MKKFILGGISTIALIVLIALLVMKLGFAPISADAKPFWMERYLLQIAVHSAVARQRPTQPPPAINQDQIAAAADIYQSLCAQCHGQLNKRPSSLGASFLPPAPQLPINATDYSESEIFWIVKHGIRNTSMPSWQRILADDEIWRVSMFVKQLGHDSSAHNLPANNSAK